MEISDQLEGNKTNKIILQSPELGQLEGMSSKEKGKLLQKLWKEIDLDIFVQKFVWKLNVPKCSCESCDRAYQTWLERGKELYKEIPHEYERIVEKENSSRKQGKILRELISREYIHSMA